MELVKIFWEDRVIWGWRHCNSLWTASWVTRHKRDILTWRSICPFKVILGRLSPGIPSRTATPYNYSLIGHYIPDKNVMDIFFLVCMHGLAEEQPLAKASDPCWNKIKQNEMDNYYHRKLFPNKDNILQKNMSPGQNTPYGKLPSNRGHSPGQQPDN